MAYSEALAQRIRDILSVRRDVVEKKMFGGIAFMVAGRMACGPQGDALIVRIGQAAAAEHIGTPHVKPMDFTGRVMRAFATIEPEGIRTSTQLRKWVNMAAEFAAADGKVVPSAKTTTPQPTQRTKCRP